MVEATHCVEVAGHGVQFLGGELPAQVVELLIGLAAEDPQWCDTLSDKFKDSLAPIAGIGATTHVPGDFQAVDELLEGIDAVISTVGIGTSKQPTTLYSEGTRNLVNGMARQGLSRIVTISSEVADHWAHQSPLKLWVVLPLLQRFLGASYDDMRRMDIVLWESDAQWMTVRAPYIHDRAQAGSYRIATDKPLRKGFSITAPDMATALLDIAERNDLGRTFVFVAN